MQTVRSSNVAKYVNNKKTLYLACARNGYLLPPERDPIVTFDFLDSVRVGLIWLPKTHECVGKYLDKLNELLVYLAYSCPSPPSKEILAGYISEAIQEGLATNLRNEP